MYPILDSLSSVRCRNNAERGYGLTVSIVSSGVISMAEALGVVASIGGLAAIASKVTMLCYNYFSEAVNAQEDIQQLVSEISSLAKILAPLSTPAQANIISRALDSDSILQLVQQCKEMLGKL